MTNFSFRGLIGIFVYWSQLSKRYPVPYLNAEGSRIFMSTEFLEIEEGYFYEYVEYSKEDIEQALESNGE